MKIGSELACDVVRHAGRYAMIRMEGRYYIVSVRDYHVYSCLPSDMPPDGTVACSLATESGVRYVAHGRSRGSADYQWRRYIAPRCAE